MENGFCKASLFVATVISLTLLLTTNNAFLQSLERKAHNFGAQPRERDAYLPAVILKKTNNAMLAILLNSGQSGCNVEKPLPAAFKKNVFPKITDKIDTDKRFAKGQEAPKERRRHKGFLT